MEIRKIAVLGAGTMGPGLAETFAMYGYPVTLYSRTADTLETARGSIAASLAVLAAEEMLPDGDIDTVLSRICYTTSLEDAVDGAWYVAETIVEKPEAKAALYTRLDEILPEGVILSSNTSLLNIFELMPAARQSHTVIAHWFTPPHIMPLVEVVRGPETLDDVMDTMVSLHRNCGKTAIRMERFIPGYIINRMQNAIMFEAFHLIENGYCTAEEIDLAAKTSLMPRGLLMGIMGKIDFSGVDMTALAFENTTYIQAPDPGVPPSMTTLCAQGDLGFKSGKGFFSYQQKTREETLQQMERQLLQSVQLAKEFIENPLADKL